MGLFSGRKHGGLFTFNRDDGYLEAILRDYNNLCQCDTLEDMKMHFLSTDYGDFLAGEPSPIHTTTIAEKATQKLVNEFNHIRNQAVEPLSTFMDFISYGYMIDNVVLLITGTLHERDISELVDKCHPLGLFKSMATLSVVHNVADLYNNVLIDTPLAPYIQNCLSEEDLDEMNIEIIRNTLYKAYLEDFYNYCKFLGGQTELIMNDILQFEADRRSINITINSFGATELTKDDREKLYPQLGLLFPEGTSKLSKAEDVDQVRGILEVYSTYRSFFADGVNNEKSLEDSFFEHEVHLNRMAFEDQYGYGVFYAYIKLREQEIRNIVWIAECISQNMKQKMNQYIPIF
ncbi:hypothetical protein DICPUDRAFT_96211 [Dictyostelium purpureum]|uniref:V-type proton ATPase subunit n=1 Tax=Dictyostelium purpureum TaxID=5786 RepID=F1A6C6_DICPU|nr:uncharacterized protein DICPUDRAFT_96211 [Dictyostelium purpureum]EGC28253.1 hypothetical protein DICPUDRAFT_96211 [Dictyostelium purpureum]|eukprot:XP_003295220.1 hypothetical protein DICPUDRAFT_96211 [Dictyostelium purpureum]